MHAVFNNETLYKCNVCGCVWYILFSVSEFLFESLHTLDVAQLE